MPWWVQDDGVPAPAAAVHGQRSASLLDGFSHLPRDFLSLLFSCLSLPSPRLVIYYSASSWHVLQLPEHFLPFRWNEMLRALQVLAPPSHRSKEPRPSLARTARQRTARGPGVLALRGSRWSVAVNQLPIVSSGHPPANRLRAEFLWLKGAPFVTHDVLILFALWMVLREFAVGSHLSVRIGYRVAGYPGAAVVRSEMRRRAGSVTVSVTGGWHDGDRWKG